MTHYQRLGVPETASSDELKRAYRQRARDLHPDRHDGNSAYEEALKLINAAYEVLSDPVRRAAYDEELRAGRELAAALFRRTEQRLIAAATSEAGHDRSGGGARTSRGGPRPFAEALLATLAAAGTVAVFVTAVSSSSTSWDPATERYRDRRGRFSRG